MSKVISPNRRETISAQSTITGEQEYLTSTNGALNTTATISAAGVATSDNQTNGDQKTQIVDAGGDAVTVTGGKLDVNASIDTTGLATSAKQDTGNASLASIDGKITAVNTGAVVVASSALPTGAATAALQTQPGVDIGDVTINNASGASAVNIQDGGNSITVDGTVAATQSGTWSIVGNKTNNNAAPSTDNIGVLPALINASSPTLTEGDQSLLSIDTAGNMRATVNKIGGNAINTGNGTTGSGTQRVTISSDSTGQVTLAAGSNTIGSLTANQSVNVAQMNGVTVSMNNGTAGTGVQRVTLASDSTGQVAPAASSTATGTAIYNNTALSNTKQAVNASAGNLYGYHIYNPNTSVIYVQLFNLASASVTVGTTAPTAVLAIPPLGWADAEPATPIAFGTALTIAATTTSTGSVAPTTALLANFWYK